MVKLTDLDKKILFELEKDGRASYSKIARNIETSPQVVKYHMARLIDEEVIKHFWAFIDYDRVGYSFFWGYWLKFSGLTNEGQNEMFLRLKENKNIPIVFRCDGYADAFIAIIAKDVFGHNKILQDVFNEFGKFITMSEIVVGLGFLKFPRTYFLNKENEEGTESVSGGFKKTLKLSDLDQKILSILQIDGRMEFSEMAKVLGTTVGVIHRSYTKMVKRGVITKTTFTLNYQNINMKMFRVLFKIKQFQEERVSALYQFCLRHPHIVNYVKVMGNWQLMLDLEVRNRKALREIINQMKHDFNDIIFQVEVNEVYQIDKFTQMALEYPDILSKKKENVDSVNEDRSF